MSNESIKNKLVNSMKMTKAGTATTTTATEKKEEPKAEKKPAKKAPARKKAVAASASGFSSGTCRVWPD